MKPRTVAAPQPAQVKPLIIPAITWSSSPPPIPPRSFSTPPPVPPSSPTAVTEPPPAGAAGPPPATKQEPNAERTDEEEEDETRVQPEDVRRALEIRDEARALLQQTLEEALAPLHYAVRDLERRLAALEHAHPPASPQPPPSPNTRPLGILPPPEVRSLAVARVSLDAYGVAVVSPEPNAVVVPPAPRVASIDWEVPFDGARRRRRIGVLLAIFLLLVFGSLFGALISSRL